MKYSELNEIAERYGWEKIRDDRYWLLFTKNNINIEICKYQIDIDITLWVNSSEGETNLNDELDFINACIELGKTPLADRKGEKRFIIPLPNLITTDGEQQYLSHNYVSFFASKRNKSLKQIWKEEYLKFVPEIYRRFAVEFNEGKEH